MSEHKGLPIEVFVDQASWQDWLKGQGTLSAGLWLKFAKAGSGVTTLSKSQAIETALAHGWIDGQLDKFDERFWLVRFTPRGPKSKWSEINRATAIQLIAAGAMTPAGQAQIDKAKADGRWDAAYAPQSRAEIPEDLAMALDAQPKAKAFFASLKGANRYAVIYRINDAKTDKTRKARIAKFVDMLGRGETIYPAKA